MTQTEARLFFTAEVVMCLWLVRAWRVRKLMESQVNRIPSCGAASEVAGNTNLVYQSDLLTEFAISIPRQQTTWRLSVAASRLGKFLGRDSGLADSPGA